MILGKSGHIHFVGIGGIGMSGIAEVLLNLGFKVSGSDIERGSMTERLVKLGAKVRYGHSEKHVKGSDVVVVSSAVGPSNPEIIAAKAAGIPVIPRTEMLGELMRVRTGIAVAGVHGKTTTTSIAAAVFEEAGLDPTVVVGGRVKSMRTNARLGAGEFLIAEADESDGKFVRLSPVFAIITNIDAEHLDFYGGLENINEAFVNFANRVPFYGAVICCIDDPLVRSIVPRIDRRIRMYGFGADAHVRGIITETGSGGTSFGLTIDGKKAGKYFLKIPGKHHVLNSLGICALADLLGIPFRHVKSAFAHFEGVARRFELKGEADGILFVDDYAHHPTEVTATIEAARETYERRIVVVFQPHRYTRTRDLHERFESCFKGADEVFITDIYPAGEHPIPGVSGDLVYRAALRGGSVKVNYLPTWDDLREAVSANIRSGDLVMTLGAGNIWKLAEELLEERKK